MKMTVVSKESVGVNYKDGIYAQLRLKLQFESNWYFCYFCFLLKATSRNKVSNNHLVSNNYFLKSVQNHSSKQVFLKFGKRPVLDISFIKLTKTATSGVR